jgi:hypothetical protein
MLPISFIMLGINMNKLETASKADSMTECVGLTWFLATPRGDFSDWLECRKGTHHIERKSTELRKVAQKD